MGKEKEIKTIEDLPGVGPQAAEKLIAAGYKTLEAVAVASPAELIEAASLGGQVTLVAPRVSGSDRFAAEFAGDAGVRGG